MSTINSIKASIIDESKEDFVGLWNVIWEIRNALGPLSPEELKTHTLELVLDLLSEKEVEAGVPAENWKDFTPWRVSPEEAINRIEQAWDNLGREPSIGEIVWFNSPAIGITPTPVYPVAVCYEYVSGLGSTVLPRALTMFSLLAERRRVRSEELVASITEAKKPSDLSSLLTNHLKRRARSMKLPNPWLDYIVNKKNVWEDYEGTAGRMVLALNHETMKRNNT